MTERTKECAGFRALFLLSLLLSTCANAAALPREVDGIYPHLAMFNGEDECGTGAVVPWAGSLWAVTYGPHCPNGSSDKLYEIKPDLTQVVRAESVGGTASQVYWLWRDWTKKGRVQGTDSERSR